MFVLSYIAGSMCCIWHYSIVYLRELASPISDCCKIRVWNFGVKLLPRYYLCWKKIQKNVSKSFKISFKESKPNCCKFFYKYMYWECPAHILITWLYCGIISYYLLISKYLIWKDLFQAFLFISNIYYLAAPCQLWAIVAGTVSLTHC